MLLLVLVFRVGMNGASRRVCIRRVSFRIKIRHLLYVSLTVVDKIGML
jgi:hypothetical protein